jgi:TetR/AcrR family transcriptional repressor of nem operon
MRYDSGHKQQTRERVLRAAGRAIRADGPHRVAVAGIMASAGLTHGGFYAHFGSKDDLVAAAIDSMFEDSRATLAKVAVGETPAAALRAYIDSYLSERHRDTSTAGCPIPFLSADIPRLPGPVRERFAAGLTALTAALAELIGRLGRENATGEAGSMLAELVGALSLARAEPDLARSNAILENSRTLLKRRFQLGPAP